MLDEKSGTVYSGDGYVDPVDTNKQSGKIYIVEKNDWRLTDSLELEGEPFCAMIDNKREQLIIITSDMQINVYSITKTPLKPEFIKKVSLK